MIYFPLSHSQERGAFCLSADGSIAYRYWVKHPVLLDLRPADCVTTSASNTGCFVMLYFIRSGQYVKIGVSARPWARLAEFQTANPEPLEMLAIGPGDFGFEAELHKLFGEHRGAGEWFRDNERIRAVVAFMHETFPELQGQPHIEVITTAPAEIEEPIEDMSYLPTGPRTMNQLASMSNDTWRIETNANGNGRLSATWGWRRRGPIREYHYGGLVIATPAEAAP